MDEVRKVASSLADVVRQIQEAEAALADLRRQEHELLEQLGAKLSGVGVEALPEPAKRLPRTREDVAERTRATIDFIRSRPNGVASFTQILRHLQGLYGESLTKSHVSAILSKGGSFAKRDRGQYSVADHVLVPRLIDP